MSTLSSRRALAALAAAGTLLLAALAAAPRAEASTIYACVKKKTGAARFVGKGTKCKKGETKLSWNTEGPPGKNGLNGAPGKEGAAGKEGATGPRGPGIVATGSSSGSFSCTLAAGENFCFEPELAFTPSVNAKCVVSIIGQVAGFASGKPTVRGPYFRIAIQTNGENGNDENYGYYFQGTSGTESTSQTRTRVIAVNGGTTYNFGGFYGSPEGEWEGKKAKTEMIYICFGS